MRDHRHTSPDHSLPASVSTLELTETLVALANSRGGNLQIDLGETPVEAAMDHVREASLKAVPVLILPLPVVANEKSITVNVPRGLPHVFSVEGRYLFRYQGTNQDIPPHELRRLLLERGGMSYEEEIARNATLDDLDWRKVEAYTKKLSKRFIFREPTHDIMAQRGCIIRQGRDWLPTYAGILLFGKDPQRFIRSAYITAARFAGLEMSDAFTRQDIGGTLPDQIERAEVFLRDTLRQDVQLGSSMQRTEQFEYPMEASRELVVNAVCHRDYSIYGDGIRLFIFGDHFEVISPGGLPGPVTVDNIAEERYSRNSIIVQVLSDMGYIERLGYGVDRVIASMRDHHLPPPEFTETSGGFRVRLFNNSHPPIPVRAIPEPTEYLGHTLNSRQEKALHYLMEGEQKRITNKDLQELFPDVHTETLRRDLADLVHKGILRKLGQKRGSYYVLQNQHVNT